MSEPIKELVEAGKIALSEGDFSKSSWGKRCLVEALAAAEKWLEGVEPVDGLTGGCNAPAMWPAGQQYQYCPKCGRPIKKG